MIWIVALAHATVPEWPTPHAPVDEQCEQAYAVEVGVTVPPDLASGGVGNCGAVCFPTADAANLIDVEAYAEQLRELYQVDLIELQEENQRLQDVINEPTALTDQPTVNRWLGRAEGTVVGVLVGIVGWQIYQTQSQ